MIDHTGVSVTDMNKAVAFYEAALAPLGYTVGMRFGDQAAGFKSADGHMDFWIGGKPNSGTHVAFRAKGRDAVKKFYEAALAAGGTDNGAPGPRPHYHENYYAAFVRDPDGNNIEAVCHEPYLD